MATVAALSRIYQILLSHFWVYKFDEMTLHVVTSLSKPSITKARGTSLFD